MDTGICKIHKTEFTLTEGCPLCLAEKRDDEHTVNLPVSVEGDDLLGVPGFQAFAASEITSQEEADKIALAMLAEHPEHDSVTVAIELLPGEDTEVANYYEQALGLKDHAERRVIKTIDDLKLATDDLSLISKIIKAMAAKRKEKLQPYEDKKKAINDNYKFWMEPIEAANSITREKMTAFDAEQRRIRQAQEEINRKRLEAAQEEMKLTGELSESVNLVEVTPEAKRVSTEMGTAGMMDVWKYEIVDLDALSREYMMPDHAMLNNTAKKHHDQKPVSGVRFYNEPTIRMNTR